MSRDITVFFADGTSHVYAGAPDDVTPDQVSARARSDFPDKQIRHMDGGRGKTVDTGITPPAPEPTPEPEKQYGGFLGSFKEAVQTLGLADEAAAYAANPSDENRRAFLKAAESKYKSAGFGEGKNWEAFKEMLGSSLGFIAAPALAATVGSVGTPLAGLAAGAGATMSQYEIQNLQRQAEEQERAIAEGRKPEELSLGKATLAAAGETALDVAEFGVFRKLAKAFPFVRNLVSSEEEVAKDAAQKLVQAAKDGTLKTTRRGVVEGVAGGIAFEVPQELAQQALERWQAGLSLTDADAKEEFKQTAIGAAVLGPVLGGPAGALKVRDQKVRAELLKQGTENAVARLQQIESDPNPTPEEKAEAEFIRKNADDPVALAKRYPTPVQAEKKKPVTTEEAPPAPPAPPAAPEITDEEIEAQRQAEAERQRQAEQEEYQREQRERARTRYDAQTLREAAEAERMAPEDREAPYYPPATTPATSSLDRTEEYLNQVQQQVEQERQQPEARAAAPTPTTEPEEITAAKDLLAAVDKGGMILNPAKVNNIARNLGLEVSAKAKPVETVERIRQAVNRVAPTPTSTPEVVTAPEKAEAKPDRISRRIIESGYGSDFVRGLYEPDPIEATRDNFSDLDTVTRKEIQQSRDYIKNLSQNMLRQQFGDEITLYRGVKGTEDKTPVLSYSLDRRTAEYFANKQGIRSGKIEEIKVPVSQVLSYSEAIGKGPLAEEEVLIANPRVQKAAVTPTGEKGGPEQTARKGAKETDVGAVGRGVGVPAQRAGTQEQPPARVSPVRVGEPAVSAPDVVAGEGERPSPLTSIEEWLAKNKKKRTPEDSALFQAALDYVRATNKASAVGFMNKLGITMSKAKALRQALLGSGAVVQKTNVKGAKEAGNYFVVEGTYKPVEPVITEGRERAQEEQKKLSKREVREQRVKQAMSRMGMTPYVEEEKLTEGEEARRQMDDAEEKVMKTLPPTLKPEIGQGEYGLRFRDKDGNIAYRAYPTAAERNNARVDLYAEGARDFSTFSREAELVKHETNFINGLVAPGLPKTKTKIVGGKQITYMSDQLRAAIEGVKNARSRVKDQLGLFAEEEAPTPKVEGVTVNRTKISELLTRLIPRLREEGKIKKYFAKFQEISNDLKLKETTPKELVDHYKYLQRLERNLDIAEGELGEAEQARLGENIYEEGEEDVELPNRILRKLEGEEDFLEPEKEGRRKPLNLREQVLSFRPGRALNRFMRRRSETLGVKVGDAEIAVESFIKNWKNAPKVEVVQSYTDLPMEEGVDPDSYADTLGMTSEDGTVYLVADNIKNLSELKAVLYHESLGHYGLAQLFRDKLTDTLHDIYRTNATVRAAVDAWMEANPDAYSEYDLSRKEQEALATEEVFAEMAESGPMRDPSWRRAFYRVAALVRKFARALSRMVGKDLAYTNAEVQDILIQAHDKVLTGKVNTIPRYNNVRFMREKYNKVLSNAIDRVQKNAPEATRGFLIDTINAISRLPDKMRDYKLSILSMHHMTQLYEKYVPSIRTFEVMTERMANSATEMLVEYQKRAHEYRKIMRANKQLVGEFNAIGHLVNLSQVPLFRWNATDKKFEIDPASNRMLSIPANSTQYNALNDKDKMLHEAANRFNALPADMQRTMIGIASDYRNYSDQGFDIKFQQILKVLPPTVAQRIRNTFQTNRLQFYLPLRRTGMYRLRYTNANGNPVTEFYTSEAERVLGRQKAEAAGAIPGTFKESGVGESSYEGARAPTGLLKEILDGVEQALTRANLPRGTIDETTALIFDTFVDFMPGTSGNDLRQEISSRKTFMLNGVMQYGRLGFDEDILSVYDRAVPRMIYQLNNLKYTLPLENVRKKMKEDIATYKNNKGSQQYTGLPEIDDDYMDRIEKNLDKRLRFIKNPIYSKYVYALARTNYIYSIALNVSSAIVNTTVIPMITWPTLVAKYGFADASLAIEQAMKMYSKHSYTDPVTGKLKFNAEPSFGSGLEERINATTNPAEKAALKEFALFHRALLNRSVIGASAEQELRQAQSLTGSAYENLSDKLNLVTSYAFRSSERFNREVTALASYMLARNMNPDGTVRTASRGKANIRKAIDDAVRLNTEVNGASLAETNAQFYQTNLGRIILTFRTQPLNMMINLAMTTRDAIRAVEPDPVKRKILTNLARKKILGIFATTFMLAGIKGLPMFGAAEILAALMMGDDDEPYDLEQEGLKSVDTLGMNGPVNELFNIDMASRTGFYGLFWRDDPKRLAEVGLPIYVLERIGGPTVGLLDRARRGFKDLSDGDMVRASEEFTPAPIRNMIKGMRYAVEGATTKRGLPYTQDVSNYNIAMQLIGFAPADVAVAQSQLGAKYEIRGKLDKRRTALMVKYCAAVEAQNDVAKEEAVQAILKFNKANPSIKINGEQLNKSLQQRRKEHREAIAGMYQPPKYKQAISKYVADTSKKED